MAKCEKSAVNYSAGQLHSHCGPTFHDDKYYCQHFLPKAGRVGTCERVEGGIEPTKWCELFIRVKP